MSLLNIFKKKEEPKKKKKAVKAAKPVVEKKEEIIKPVSAKKKVIGFSYSILDFPHITEKATYLAEKNKYVFRVGPEANKSQIKKAIENNYGVAVDKVHIINVKPKQRRIGKNIGFKKGYKKAIIEVAQGQKIEILPR